MTTVTFQRVLTAQDAGKLIGSNVPEMTPTITAQTYARDADTGELVFAYVPVEPVADLRRAVLDLKMNHTMRARHIDNVSRTFGYRTRKPRMSREECGLASVARDHPASYMVLESWADRLAGMFHDFNGPQADTDAALVGREVITEWRMGELWTSGVVNKSSRLPYHRDRNNFPTWSAMPVVRRDVVGGYLSIPEYGAVLECRDGWALFFAGHELVHGVTPMWLTAADGYRYSIVFYALRGMKDCHTAALETARARAKRTERERDMAARLTAGDSHIKGQ